MKKAFYLVALLVPTALGVGGCSTYQRWQKTAELGILGKPPAAFTPSAEFSLPSPFPRTGSDLLRGSRLAIPAEPGNADRAARKIAALGFYPTEVQHTGGVCQVLVGPTYEDATEAESLLADLHRSGYEVVEILPGR